MLPTLLQLELDAISKRIDEEREATERSRAEATRLRESAEFDAAMAAALRAEQRVAQEALDRRESELAALNAKLVTEQANVSRDSAENKARASELAIAESRLAAAMEVQRNSAKSHEAAMEDSVEQLKRARAKLAQAETEAQEVLRAAQSRASDSQAELESRAVALERQAFALQQQAEALRQAEDGVAEMRAQLDKRSGIYMLRASHCKRSVLMRTL